MSDDKVFQENKECMMDKLHSCLICGEKAFEFEENKYVCSDKECGFVWRVIKSNE